LRRDILEHEIFWNVKFYGVKMCKFTKTARSLLKLKRNSCPQTIREPVCVALGLKQTLLKNEETRSF
jgi:hypothetical protein